MRGTLRSSVTALFIFIALTGAAQNCCTPSTWLGQEWFAGEEEGMVVGCRGTVYYDANSTRLRLDYTMNVSFTGNNESEHLRYTLWYEYHDKVFYYYNNITKDCAPFPLLNGTTYPWFCTNAYGPAVQYIGNAQIGTAPAQIWGNSTFQLALSAEGCLPIFTRTATSTYAPGMNSIYWDVVPSLPSYWWHMPPHCRNAALRSVDSLSHTEAAALELVHSKLRRYELDA